MTLFDYINKYASLYPDKVALKDEKNQITYSELVYLIEQYSEHFKKQGIEKNSRVILKQSSSSEWVVMLLALLFVPCWVIPVSHDLSAEELGKTIEISHTNIVVGDNIGEIELLKGSSFNKELQLPEENTGIYHMTSGSTGIPKYCIRTLDALTNEGLSYKNTLKITHEDSIACIPPLYHSYALGAACMASLVSGASLYIIKEFLPRKTMEAVENEKPSILILVPVMAKTLSLVTIKREYDFSSLKTVLVGAGPISESVHHRFMERFKLPLMSNYGSTETGGVISRLTKEPKESIGRPMVGVQLKIISVCGKEDEQGEAGELWIKCPGMLEGYLNDEGCPLDEDGYFPIGDLAVQDSDGYIYLKGRKKSIIKIGGKTVNPGEIEQILLKIQGINDCHIYGVMNEYKEEMIKALIVTNENYTMEDIIQYCAEHLSGYKVPRIIEFVRSIPRNELGKVKIHDIQ